MRQCTKEEREKEHQWDEARKAANKAEWEAEKFSSGANNAEAKRLRSVANQKLEEYEKIRRDTDLRLGPA